MMVERGAAGLFVFETIGELPHRPVRDRRATKLPDRPRQLLVGHGLRRQLQATAPEPVLDAVEMRIGPALDELPDTGEERTIRHDPPQETR